MNIITPDGRAFSGTAAQIVRGMRELSFYPGDDLRGFIAASVERLRASGGPDIGEPFGDDDEALCRDFLARLEATGAVTRGVNGTVEPVSTFTCFDCRRQTPEALRYTGPGAMDDQCNRDDCADVAEAFNAAHSDGKAEP